MHRAERTRAGERRVGEGAQRQGQERLIYLVGHEGLPFSTSGTVSAVNHEGSRHSGALDLPCGDPARPIL
ncbi:hypothetical protein GCM10010392_67000 [Streptomyces clavifer]|nr:hypothetical protein GCM10010392_67000 [Streptomyces clavifer]